MIPGTISRMTESTVASAAIIDANTDIVNVTGTTQVNTINPNLSNAYSQFLVLIPLGATLVLGTTGNIAVGITAVQNRPVFMVFSKAAQKWLINSGV